MEIPKEALECKDCSLCEERIQIVWGDGPEDTDVVAIGEAPGKKESELGLPFVGKSGQFLRQVFVDGGINPYILNMVQCRPPKNRDPKPEEIQACYKWLEYKMKIIRPKVVVTAGRYSTSFGLGIKPSAVKITKISGKRFKAVVCGEEVMVFPLLHPAYILRPTNPFTKGDYVEHAANIAVYCQEHNLKGVI